MIFSPPNALFVLTGFIDGKSIITPVRNLLSRTRSNTQIQPNQLVINLAEELLASIPCKQIIVVLQKNLFYFS